MTQIPCTGFSLAHTLDSGQFFRYHLHEGWYYIVTRDKVFRIRQEGNVLYFEGVSARFVRHFFGLDEDYSRILRKLSKDAALASAIKAYPGLRLIRQDPWECTIGFLCSQFSNIKKIKKNMECIAQEFGKPVHFKGRKFFGFPKPGEINDLARLKKCAVGFRAKYILWVNGRLTEMYGIGEKVADCILLFSLGFTESFPVDVWMERAIKEIYLNGRKLPLRKMGAWGREHWGKLAGYAQQYLYHWRRLHK